MLISWPGFSADMDLRGAFWSTGGRKWGTNWSRHWCWVTQWRWPTAGSWGTHTVLGWFVWLWLAKKKLKNLRNGFLGGVVSRTFYDFHPNSWGDVKIWGIFCNCIEPTMVRSVAPSEVLKLPKGMMMPQLPNPSGYLISPCLLFTLPPIIMFQLENGCTLYIISNMNVSFHFFGWVFQPLNHDEMGETTGTVSVWTPLKTWPALVGACFEVEFVPVAQQLALVPWNLLLASNARLVWLSVLDWLGSTKQRE